MANFVVGEMNQTISLKNNEKEINHNLKKLINYYQVQPNASRKH
jgi:hypothetical protein